MPEVRNIVILGASYAGLSATHYIARHVLPAIVQDEKVAYRILLIDPSKKCYLRHAAPRAVASANFMPDDHIFLDIQTGLWQYGRAIEFIQARAMFWDPVGRTVTIAHPRGRKELLACHALVLATGTKTSSPLFTLQDAPHLETQASLHAVRNKLGWAEHVVIVGGGASGVETAGEIGHFLNGSSRWRCPKDKEKQVQITLYTNSDKLFPLLRRSTAQKAEKYLQRLGVDVRYSTKIVSATETDEGKIEVLLHDGQTTLADVYIPATGLTPSTEYAPKQLLDGSGYIKTSSGTLRVDEAGPRTYAIGDVAFYSGNSTSEIIRSIPVLGTNMKRDLLASHVDLDATPAGPDRTFKPSISATQLIAIGRSYGVGEVYGWRVPS